MDDNVRNRIIGFIEESTRSALFPVVGYYVDSTGDESEITLLTTNIKDLPVAIDALRHVAGQEYNLGRHIPRTKLQKASQENRHLLKSHSTNVPKLTREDVSSLGLIIRVLAPSPFKQKAFALVDLCGFSELGLAEQLAQLYGLTNIVRSAQKRCEKFCRELSLPHFFGSASTGDGFYLWHDSIGGAGDVAVFMLLLSIMAHMEWMRADGFPMRLRAGYAIDSAYLLYKADDARLDHPLASNAVGPATNLVARLLEVARPSQILIADFRRAGPKKTEVMTPRELISQADDLFRTERCGSPTIAFDPDEVLRMTDKRGTRRYCWNMVGEIPNVVRGRQAQQRIGLQPELTRDISDISFKG